MGYAIKFDEFTNDLGRPKNMTEEQCSSLPVQIGMSPDIPGVPSFISCWEFTKEELEEINRTGHVYLNVLANTHSPVNISAFKQEQIPL